jgi:hypothetical protein
MFKVKKKKNRGLYSTKKAPDDREFFTQLLDFSLNISKQGPLVG